MTRAIRWSMALVLAAAAAIGASAHGQALDAFRENLTSPDEDRRLREIERIGSELYRLDQLAWHATDALTSRGRPARGGGWIVRDGAVPVVTFATRDRKGRYEWLADVEMPAGAKPRVVRKPKRTLSDAEHAALVARETALTRGASGCTKTYNTVMLPVDGGGWDVYVLAATTDAKMVVVGGHARVRVAADGEVGEIERYSKSCLELDRTQKGPDGATPAFLMATHIVDDLPAPTHVFIALSQPTPLMIGTRTRIWGVERGRITALDRRE